MATRNLRPPLKHTPFTELMADGTQFVSNSWYDWALNLALRVETLETQVTELEEELASQDDSLQRLLTADVAVFAPQMLPTLTDGCEPIEVIEFTPVQPNLVALPFLTGVDTSADFHAMLPFAWAGKKFKTWVYWGHGDGSTDQDVVWEVVANSTFDDEPITINFVSGIMVGDQGGTGGNLYIARSESVPISSYRNRDGSLISMRIFRRGTHAEDTLDITAYLLAVRFILDDVPLVPPEAVPGELYLRFEGNFDDSSTAARTVTNHGAARSTNHPGGGLEGMVGNGGGYLSVVDDGAFDIAGRIFQLRFHLYVSSSAVLNTDNIICGKWGATDGSWFVNLYGPNGRLNWGRKSGGYFFDAITDAAIPLDTLVQVTIWAYVVNGQVYCAIDGVVQTPGSASCVCDSTSNDFAIGAVIGGGAALPAGVYADELQFAIDATDYTDEDFTPPTPPYT